MSSAPIEELVRAALGGPTIAYGMTPPLAAYAGARALSHEDSPPLFAVTPDEASARRLTADLRFFWPGADGVLRIPSIDTSPYAEQSPDRRELYGRMTALYRLARGLAPRAVVASAASMIRLVPPPGELAALSRVIRVGDELDRDEAARSLLAAGFARAPVVEDPGTFAVRGGVIDIYSPLDSAPVRIELFGDEVETMRAFDPGSQRGLRDVSEVHIMPVRPTVATRDADVRARILEAADAAAHPSSATRRVIERVAEGEEFVGIDTLTPAFHARMVPLWEALPGDAMWLVLHPDGCTRAVIDELEVAADRYQARLGEHLLAFPVEAHYASHEAFAGALARSPRRIEVRDVEMHDPSGRAPPSLRFEVDAHAALRAELERARTKRSDEPMSPLCGAVSAWREGGYRVAVACESSSRGERIAALLTQCGHAPHTPERAPPIDALEPGAPPTIIRGALSSGFALASERLALLTESDIFGKTRAGTRNQRAAAKRARDALYGRVSDFSQLQPGDYLVHQLHGVGQYQGLTKLPLRGTPIDFLHLEYVGGSLYLPVYRIGEVQRYVGAEGHKPKIDRLGGQTWDKARRKVKREVRALAEELLKLYAQRAALPGFAHQPADAMVRDFEAAFEFEETPDQQKAIDDVHVDMERERPMDRLVCGDVGYGKTEVALRACLKAVVSGKQVAFLAPTTVLVEQHFQTMQSRFSGWPIQIAKLSRFQSKAAQNETIRGLASGAIDAVVGTHRLLSNDVRFKDLGLMVIDEEQRFGVAHKEKLKRARTQIDVLTLTATPIPRTLHLSLAGLRDLSIIATPPADRRSIRTLVARPEDGVLREGVRRELGRGGQVFFVAPRIGDKGRRERSLSEWAEKLRELVPEARVAVAHGQMASDELEKVMVAFVAGDYDILVSTTIIESGLDIPRANTMFVASADRFGLSQLYQLRGRIGRSSERAFCYLLVPPPEVLTREARMRLEALQRFSELGAGFQIASHDLEIRGAGELFGAKQSGAIAAVGFETYTAMLEEAVAELKGEELSRPSDPELNIDIPGFIPDDYVPDTGQRLDLYKRLASADDEDEVRDVLGEIEDRYGPLPLEVTTLGDLMVLKGYARKLRAQSLDLSATQLTLALAEDTPLEPTELTRLVAAGAKTGNRYKLTPDMRVRAIFTRAEAENPIASARARLVELCRCA